MNEQDRILSRVRKMFNLAADSGATEGERDNALRMAHATLAKYNLDISSVEDLGKDATVGEQREQQTEQFLGVPWARAVAFGSAQLFFCSYFFSRAAAGKVKHNFIGRHSNAVTAMEMAKYLVESIHNEARAYQRSTGGTNTQYTSFAFGAAAKVVERCKTLRAASEKPAPEVPAASTGMSLAVVYRNEDSENRKFIASSGVKLSTANARTRVRDSDARIAGRAYGNDVSLNRQIGR